MALENETKIIERGHAHPLATVQRSGFLSPDEKAYLEAAMDVTGLFEVVEEVHEARGDQPDLKTRLLELEQMIMGDIPFSTLKTEFFTATEGQTLFTLDGEYRPGINQLDVFIGGIKQRVGTSYTEIDSKRIMMSEPLGRGQVVEFKYFKDTPAITSDVVNQVFTLQNEVNDARTTSLGVSYPNLKERIDALDQKAADMLYDAYTTDGTQTDFILANGEFLLDGDNTEIYLDGLTLELGRDYEIVSTTTVRLATPPAAGKRLVIKTQTTIAPIINPPDFNRTYFTFNVTTAGTRTISLPKDYITGMRRLDVYRNGVYQAVDRHYLESSKSSIYFASALAVGDVINVTIYADGIAMDLDYKSQLDDVQTEMREARFNASNVESPTLKARILSAETTLTNNYTSLVNSTKTTIDAAYKAADTALKTTLTSDFTAADTVVTNAYKAADTALKTTITSEYTTAINAAKTQIATDYAAADTVVTNAYKAADTALKATIATDYAAADTVVTNAYKAADTALKNTIATDYAAADAALKTQIATDYAAADTASRNTITTAYTAAIATAKSQIATDYAAADTALKATIATDYKAADTALKTTITGEYTTAINNALAEYDNTDYITADEALETSLTDAFTAADVVVTNAYKAADTALKNTIATDYAAADAALKTTIETGYAAADTTVTNAYKAADTALKTTITSEYTTAITNAKAQIATDYGAADTALKTQIASDYTAAIKVTDDKIAPLAARVTTTETNITNLQKFAAPLVGSLPTPSATYRYQMKVVVESGEDVLYFCANVNGTYKWKPVTLT